MKEYRCRNCVYFRQHYALDSRKIFRVYCGHCTASKTRRKKPDDKICEQFVYAEPDENAFAQKEYLSKELLRYVLGLEFLPKIEDFDGKVRE